MPSNPPSNNPSTPQNSRARLALLIVSFIGFLDAAYLTIEHFQNRIPPCSINSGCETVLTSSYATVAGVPVALLGALFYMSVFFMVISHQTRWLKTIVTVAFIVSLVLLALQAFVIGAFCYYCLGSLVTSTLLCIIVWRQHGVYN